MVIRDKQELKRCVKQAVRKTLITETDFSFDIARGSLGISELLQTWAPPAGAPNDALRRASAQGTPFGEEVAAMFAALSALELPTHNLNNAQTIQESYDRSAYLREVLDAMRARRVLVRVPVDKVQENIFEDDRFAAMLAVDCASFFSCGRYGVNYEEKSNEIMALLSRCGARHLCAENVCEDVLHYALIPVSEDTGCVVHLYAADKEKLCKFAALLQAHPQARAVLSCEPDDERMLIDLARENLNMLPRLGGFDHMHYALARLNTRFIPYASCAALPEQMLGRWELARETIWQTLLDAYLPLARAGYELTSEAIARDVEQLLGGNLEALVSNVF